MFYNDDLVFNSDLVFTGDLISKYQYMQGYILFLAQSFATSSSKCYRRLQQPRELLSYCRQQEKTNRID